MVPQQKEQVAHFSAAIATSDQLPTLNGDRCYPIFGAETGTSIEDYKHADDDPSWKVYSELNYFMEWTPLIYIYSSLTVIPQ